MTSCSPRRVARLLVLAALLILPCGAGRSMNDEVNPVNGVDATAKLPPEVRLRKLHLVRPDLIQYPISFEVYC